jgi:hypothetical protein
VAGWPGYGQTALVGSVVWGPELAEVYDRIYAAMFGPAEARHPAAARTEAAIPSCGQADMANVTCDGTRKGSPSRTK